jgi:hypothetical protein
MLIEYPGCRKQDFVNQHGKQASKNWADYLTNTANFLVLRLRCLIQRQAIEPVIEGWPTFLAVPATVSSSYGVRRCPSLPPLFGR